MTRPRGSQNTMYQEKRAALLDKLRLSLTATGNDKLTFSELAAKAEVSIPTLRHYFGNRTKLIEEVLAMLNSKGQPYIRKTASALLPFSESILEAANTMLSGVRYGRMDKVHTLGLTEGLEDAALGPAYLNQILEPGLQALETRLAAHQARGEMRSGSVRHAAITFLAPLLLVSLHQNGLGGRAVRLMEMESFVRDHVDMFVRAYGTGPEEERTKP